MGGLLRNGVPLERRVKSFVILFALVGALVALKFTGVMPQFADELPQHLEKSSIDTLGDAAGVKYTELVPADLILDKAFFYLRDELGFAHVTRFLSRTLKGLINIINNTDR